MEFFPWKKEYELGFDKIDSQHKVLVSIISSLMKEHELGNDANCSDILASLKSYIAVHFNYEEDLLKENNWDESTRENHIEKHHHFRKKVDEYLETFKKGDSFLNEQILEFLKEWLYKHILVEDKKYVSFLKDKGIK